MKPEKNRLSGRQIKADILALLGGGNFDQALVTIRRLPARQAVNPLFSFLYYTDAQIRWRAITAMGVVVAQMADADPEAARVVMRRLMWNLNDESGGMGWGSPEAMGEIMARSPLLADEYAHILLSYLREDMNYLEHEALQRGLLWGVARLADARPALVRPAAADLRPHLDSPDAAKRRLAAAALTAIDPGAVRP